MSYATTTTDAFDVNVLNPLETTFQGNTIEALGDAVSAWEKNIDTVSLLAGTNINDLGKIQNNWLNSNLAQARDFNVGDRLQAIEHLQDFIEKYTTTVQYDWSNPEHQALLLRHGYAEETTTLEYLAEERQLDPQVSEAKIELNLGEANDDVLFLQLKKSAFSSGSRGFAEQRYVVALLTEMGIIDPARDEAIAQDGKSQFRVHQDFVWDDIVSGNNNLEIHVMAKEMRAYQSLDLETFYKEETLDGKLADSSLPKRSVLIGDNNIIAFMDALIDGRDDEKWNYDSMSLRDKVKVQPLKLVGFGAGLFLINEYKDSSQTYDAWLTFGHKHFEFSNENHASVSDTVAKRVTEISAGDILVATNKVTVSGSLVDAHMQVIKQQAQQVKKGAEALK